MKTKTNVTLDWADLGEEPARHYCDCSYCELEGELEGVDWPMLVTTKQGDTPYVTDRYIMLRADRAPIPDDYEGSSIEGPADLGDRWQESVTGDPADEFTFRKSIRRVVNLTGWRLMHLAHPEDASAASLRRVGVLDEHGEHIGWAIASKVEED